MQFIPVRGFNFTVRKGESIFGIRLACKKVTINEIINSKNVIFIVFFWNKTFVSFTHFSYSLWLFNFYFFIWHSSIAAIRHRSNDIVCTSAQGEFLSIGRYGSIAGLSCVKFRWNHLSTFGPPFGHDADAMFFQIKNNVTRHVHTR